MKRPSGFTLLEVLVAMAIFSVIGLGAQQMLRTIIDTHEKTRDQIQGFSELSRAFVILGRDISQTVPRGIRDEYGESLPPLMLASGPYFIELTRTGWSNPIGSARSNLQRVAYELNAEGEIERHFWLVLDRAEDSEPISQTVLTGVDDFQIQLLTEKGESTSVWPDSNSNLQIPVSAEVILQTKAFGELRKVFNFVEPFRAGQSGLGSNIKGGNGAANTSDSSQQDQSNLSINSGENTP
ncbi:MAG: general secretion pathway protein J [Patiriisocius sp.]|jgi:general secretion pathway protein J